MREVVRTWHERFEKVGQVGDMAITAKSRHRCEGDVRQWGARAGGQGRAGRVQSRGPGAQAAINGGVRVDVAM